MPIWVVPQELRSCPCFDTGARAFYTQMLTDLYGGKIMKNRKSIACALAASAMLLSFAACSSSETTNSGGASTNMAKVGVIQYATHGSLDNCYQGFKEGLAEGGYVEGENLELLFQNANGETSTSDLIAKNFVSQKVDLIGAIATPAAMSAYSATQSSGKPPIVFGNFRPGFTGLVQSLNPQVRILQVLVTCFH
ncbi:MAG: ABC transporter substrate binding protein [Acutalibacteraceae bacterium]